ncbi:MAG: hypothetical protein FJZ09_05210 [Candidatus Omnitrophica bacterium]|nr:hypothetical protein [Candidatus Omnitrophota bacterium]
MLKKLRNKKLQKKIWIILLIFIMPAFVLWGLSSAVRSRRQDASGAKSTGRKVSETEYNDALDAVKNMAIIQFGDKFNEVYRALNLDDQAWERLILLHEAKKLKVSVSDKEVIELLESYPFFQRDGEFDERTYNEMLQYVFRTQPRVFEEQTRQNIMLSRLFEKVTGKLTLSDREVREEYQKANEQISVYYIASLPADFAKNIKPSEEELKGFFEKNTLQFKQPVSFNLEYIVVDSEEKTKDAYGRLKKKADFKAVAKETGLQAKETGFFAQTDPIPGIGWSPEILGLVATLKTGEFTQPIHTEDNYYILKMKEKKESFIPDFKEIAEKVKNAYIKAESERLAREKVGKCLENIRQMQAGGAKSADFNKAAKAAGLKSDATGPFKYRSYIEGIGSSDELWTAANKLEADAVSGVIETPSGFYIVRLKEKKAIDEKEFENLKNSFGEELLQRKKQEYFSKFLEELSRKAGSRLP